jgi:hypothetical protein
VSGKDDDETWRAIVENYGERPSMEDVPPEPAQPPPEYVGDTEEPDPDTPAASEEFVPPVPPPGPPLQLPQHLPWIGVFGSPALLLLATLVGIDIPAWAGYLLVGSFAGGFVWLVATMKRGGGDPWDNGARL